jgi:hypothetical protein
MDWGRFLRAIEAQAIERVEEKRVRGIEKPDSLDADDWAAIAEHDELIARYDTD